MSIRNSLHLLWAIAVIAPTVAVLLLLLSGDSSPSAADARARQGLRTAFAVYDAARAEARAEVTSVVNDPGLREALTQAPSLLLERRAEEIVADNPRVVALSFYTADGERVVQAGSQGAVAYADFAPAVADRGRLDTLRASTTEATDLARRVRRLSGLDVRLVRGGRVLASTLPALAPGAPSESGEVEIGDEEYRAAYGSVPEPAGDRVRVGVLAHADGAGQPGSGVGTPLLIVVIAQLAVMAIAATLALLTLRRRLGELVAAARRLRGGDYRVRVPVRGDDRLASLATELNLLSDELAAATERVERGRGDIEDFTRRVGDAFASGLDPEAVIDIAVRTAVEACGADGGRALTADSDRMASTRVGDPRGRLAEALSAAEREVFRDNAAEGGEALRRGDAGRRAAVGPTIAHAAYFDGIHALAAPMRARTGLGGAAEYLGVVSIARRDRPFSESEQDLFAYLASQTAVSVENAFLHESARRQAVTDELTGLANVRRFHEALARELERTRRFSGEVSLVMVDIDHFKRVNDRFGHQQGDIVLVEVARELREQCREIDHVARYGGEEMALILPETDLPGAFELAERIRRAIARKPIGRLDKDGELTVTASFGVAAVPESAANAQELIAAADAALYRAKRAGKNRVAKAGTRAAAAGPGWTGGEAQRGASV